MPKRELIFPLLLAVETKTTFFCTALLFQYPFFFPTFFPLPIPPFRLVWYSRGGKTEERRRRDKNWISRFFLLLLLGLSIDLARVGAARPLHVLFPRNPPNPTLPTNHPHQPQKSPLSHSLSPNKKWNCSQSKNFLFFPFENVSSEESFSILPR